MAKLFDRFERLIFKGAVGRLFGERVPAVWVSVEGVEYSAIVFFSNATGKDVISDASFQPSDSFFEYLVGDFPGLKESVDAVVEEVITISGEDYFVTDVQRHNDGNNYKAYVRLVNDPYGLQNQN